MWPYDNLRSTRKDSTVTGRGATSEVCFVREFPRVELQDDSRMKDEILSANRILANGHIITFGQSKSATVDYEAKEYYVSGILVIH